jgi:hypothetical protein
MPMIFCVVSQCSILAVCEISPDDGDSTLARAKILRDSTTQRTISAILITYILHVRSARCISVCRCAVNALSFWNKKLFSTNSLQFKHYNIRNVYLIISLHECETRSVIPKEEYKLEVFENRLLIRMFGLLKQEVKWKLHNKEVQCVFFLHPILFGCLR